MKKRVWGMRGLAIVLILMVGVALAGCGATNNPASGSGGSAASTKRAESKDAGSAEEEEEEEEFNYDDHPLYIAYRALHDLGDDVSNLTYDDVVNQYLDGDPGYVGAEGEEGPTYVWKFDDGNAVCSLSIPFKDVDGTLHPSKFMQLAAGPSK